jgi:uncharacterized protein (TIGR03085 family)
VSPAEPVPTSRSSDSLARSERNALCDLLLEVGPDAPTLCGGWATRDLAAHLFVRENRPDAAMGIWLAPLSGWTDRVMGKTAGGDFPALVASIRSGPPRWSPMSIESLDADTNTIEYFVHHEDVRRAAPGWEPRLLDAEAAAALWSRLVRGKGVLLRASPVGVVARPTDGPAAGTAVTLKGGEPPVTLSGPVGEIVLAAYGRRTSGLEIDGESSDVAAFTSYAR